ncbi:hypothetical protein [Bacteroides ovatus]|uniref:hypothetical protein n=1 Tax=Bacteroides ovatus TaxID=28116 RepID=UPI0022E77543|nr:hypothetical protein [Bacteroides ovatus]
MSKIVTQDKLNELTGMSIDYGKGGGYCPHYQTIVSLWGSVVASSNYQPNQLVKEEDIVVDKDLFLINAETGSLYFAGGGTYAQIPAIDGHEDFIYIAGGGEAIGALSILGGLYVVNQSTKQWELKYKDTVRAYGYAHLARFSTGWVFYKGAGEKGALVGGFVGGMVNPKIRFGKSSSTNQIRKDLIYGSKINGKMARLSQAEAEKANQEGYHNALSVIANPVVVATAKRNAEVAKRIGFKPLVYGINGKPVEFDNSSALHFYIMADEYPTSKIVRTDLGGMATGRWVRDPKTKQDRIELDNSVGDYKTAEEIFTHENLHKGRYGETRMQMLRVNKLIDEARAAEALPQMPEYLLGAGEAAVNTNDVRRALGLEFGQKYPGWKITKEIVDMFSRSKHPKAFVMKSFKQDTPRDYKRIWDALTGKWFMYPVALGVGMDLMNY